MTIAGWIKNAANELADELFTSPRLDAEIIMAHTIRQPRTYIHGHGDDELNARDVDIANARLELRKDHVPIAYIVGHKEFYGRRFIVTPSVLIPRPESEILIEQLAALLPKTSPLGVTIGQKRLVDIGTGSGCLGITAKCEHADLVVTLADTSRPAVNVAEKNAASHSADVEIIVSDLLSGYPYTPDIIMANLPYVDTRWDVSPELQHEPSTALFADRGGYALIEKLIDQSASRQTAGGYLLLECDHRQADNVAAYAKRSGYSETDRSRFSIVLRKS